MSTTVRPRSHGRVVMRLLELGQLVDHRVTLVDLPLLQRQVGRGLERRLQGDAHATAVVLRAAAIHPPPHAVDHEGMVPVRLPRPLDGPPTYPDRPGFERAAFVE